MTHEEISTVQRAIISHVQALNYEFWASFTEDHVVHLIFLHGLRLTQYGLQILQCHFQSCRIDVPDNELHRPSHLVFLDTVAKMPYYCGDVYLVVFDHLLGFKLRLVEGRISTLKQIEGY